MFVVGTVACLSAVAFGEDGNTILSNNSVIPAC